MSDPEFMRRERLEYRVFCFQDWPEIGKEHCEVQTETRSSLDLIAVF
jgi:hypothetical protein